MFGALSFWGLGFKGFRVWCLRVRVWGLGGFSVSGFRVWGPSKVADSGHWLEPADPAPPGQARLQPRIFSRVAK